MFNLNSLQVPHCCPAFPVLSFKPLKRLSPVAGTNDSAVALVQLASCLDAQQPLHSAAGAPLPPRAVPAHDVTGPLKRKVTIPVLDRV